jgi:endonuclease-3
MRRSARLAGRNGAPTSISQLNAFAHVPSRKSSTNSGDAIGDMEDIVVSAKTTVSKRAVDNRSKEAIRANFPIVYKLIEEMRSQRNAEVDSMGAEVILEPRSKVGDKTYKFQALVAVMLSSMTKDPLTAAAIKRLQALPGGLTVKTILEIDQDDLAEVLHGVGFHNRKAEYLKQTAAILQDKYAGDLPETLEEMIELPGVGTKMAKIALSVGQGRVIGIAADTHVHRISNRLGWVKTKEPVQTEGQLESWVPEEYWKDMNLLLVGFGQQICFARNPQCHECKVKDLCPKIGVKLKAPTPKKKKAKKTQDE